MGRKKLPAAAGLIHDIKTRVTEKEFIRLTDLIRRSRHRTMSELLREIVCNKPITIYTKDGSLSEVLEEVARLRRELNAIGNNFNQVTRQINSLHDNQKKSVLIIQASEVFREIDGRIRLLYPLISSLAKQCLQK